MDLPRSSRPHLRLVTTEAVQPLVPANDSSFQHRHSLLIRTTGLICLDRLDAIERFLKQPPGPYETAGDSRIEAAKYYYALSGAFLKLTALVEEAHHQSVDWRPLLDDRLVLALDRAELHVRQLERTGQL